MMFLTLAVTFALRMSFPIVLTQMVYVPNTIPSAELNNTSHNEIVCPVKKKDSENFVDRDFVVESLLVNFFVFINDYLIEHFLERHKHIEVHVSCEIKRINILAVFN